LKQRWSESGEPGEPSESGDLRGSFSENVPLQKWNESGEPGEPSESGETDDLKGSLMQMYVFETKME
jgi:hypothetical protein